MSQNSVPSSESLLQRGYFFLKESEFKTAALYFNRVLDINPNSAQAYWGLLLCEYQCKESKELYLRLAVPISNNNNFRYAINNATEELQNEYREIEKLVLLACHKKTVINALEGNSFLAKKWENHYSAANSENKLFTEDNKTILSISKTDDNFPKFMISLYSKYEELGYGADILNSLKDIVKKEYSAAMEVRLNKISKSPYKVSESELLLWANPLSAAFSAEKAADIGLDGKPSTVADRFAFLAKTLALTNGTLNIYKKINYCYSCAAECENKEIYAADKKAYFEAEIVKDKLLKEEIDYIIGLYPEVGKFYWQYVLVFTDNLTRLPVSYIKDSAFSAFMEKAKEQYSDEDVDEILTKQKDSKNHLEREYNSILDEMTPYAEKAIKYSTDEENAEFSKKWADYKDALSKDKQKSLDAIEQRIKDIKEKEGIDNKQGSDEAHKKGIILSVLSVLVLAMSIPVGLFIKYSFESIINLIKHPLIYVYLLALAAFLVISIIQIPSALAISSYSPKKFKMPIYFRIITSIVSILSVIILPLSVGTLIYSYVKYPVNIGEIKIQSAEDLAYIKNAPRGTFSLETDLDLTDTEIADISTFKGKLLGNEHTISNLKISEDGFIKSNGGEITDIKFVSLSSDEDFNLISKNKGTLKNISLSNIVLEAEKDFTGLVDTNQGKIISCAVSEISGVYDDFVGMCYKNKGEIIASSVNNVDVKTRGGDGFAAINNSAIIGCSFSGKIDGKGTVNGFVDNINGKNASIERCFATGTVKGGQNVSAFIGSIKEGKLENCYSSVNATQMCCEYNDAIGGLIREITPDDKTNIEVKNCYFGGKITVTRGEDSNEYEVVGGLIGAANTASSTRDYSILVDSCFNVGTYNLSSVSKGNGWSAFKNSITLNNTYGLSENDIGHANIDGELKIMRKSNILATKFITNTLGWDPEIWNIKNGKLPTLKEYVVIEEETKVDNTNSLVEEE